MTTNVIETLQQLVRIPSVNPMDRDVSGDEYYEHALTDYLQQFFERLGVPWHRQSVAPKRDNILARIDRPSKANEHARIVVFEVHQDTVPTDGMIIDPWEPTVRSGRLYGRGACDVKGGMACMLTAFARLARDPAPELPTVIMACTVNEENGFTGAREMAQAWSHRDPVFIGRRPDAVVVAEPTSLDVVVEHKGVVRWRCHARGRAAHSSQPEKGENSIYHMGHALVALEQYADQLGRCAPNAHLGSPTINVGTVQGGLCVNAVPDKCTIEIDRRLLPEESPEQARQGVLDWLAQHTAISHQLTHDAPFLASNGLPDQSETSLARNLQQVIQDHGHAGNLIAVPYGTDAPFFADLGIPTVIFGPGSIDQAHTSDEWVPLGELHAATDAYVALARAMR